LSWEYAEAYAEFANVRFATNLSGRPGPADGVGKPKMNNADPGQRTAANGSPDYFDDADVKGNLRSRLVGGSAVTLAGSALKFVLNLGSTVILARLLNPEAYGLLAMVFAVTNFITLFQDMNLSLATVQRKDITHAQVSTIYWVNIAITLAVALAILAVAPGISWFYAEPRLTEIAALLCLAVILRGLGSQHKALLRRKMRFGAVAAIEVLSMIAGYIVAIMMAWKGYGYWSLVWLHIAMAGVNTALSWVWSGWRPGRPVRGSGVRSMLVFGGNLTGFTLVRYPANSLDRALIGWQAGAAPLGLYSKSFELLGPVTAYVTTPISTVAVSALSRLVETPAEYRSVYRRFMQAIAVFSLFTSVVVGCAAHDIVAVLLGEKWLGAAPILAIIGILVFVESMAVCLQWLFISQGRGGELLRYGVFDSVLRIVAILCGLPWGVIGIASAIAATSLFARLPLQIWYACRAGPVPGGDVYRAILPISIAALAALAANGLQQKYFSLTGPALGIVASVAISSVAMAVVLLMSPSGRDLLRQSGKQAVQLYRRK
jgi:PST family polysaccharide transporter